MRFKIATLLLLNMCAGLSFANTYYHMGTDSESLGNGFNQGIRMALSPCVTGDQVFHGNTTGEIAWYQSMQTEDLLSSTTGSVSAGVDFFKLFGGSVKYSMHKKVTENNNSLAITLALNYVHGTYSLENRSYTSEISNLLNTNPGAVAERCGDSFIHSITTGSNLYVTAKLHFRSREEYEWFKVRIKIKFLFFSKSWTIEEEFREAMQNAVYSVQVNTDGGLTPYLETLGTAKYCRGDDVSACMDYSDQLFAYLLNGGAYSTDLQPADFKPIRYTTASWNKSGHYELGTLASGQLPEQYLALSGRLQGYMDLINDEIEKLTAFIAVATEAELPALQAEYDLRQAEITALNEANEYCADLPGVFLCENRIEAAIDLVH